MKVHKEEQTSKSSVIVDIDIRKKNMNICEKYIIIFPNEDKKIRHMKMEHKQ